MIEQPMNQPIFKCIKSLFREAGVQCVLVGGYAVNAFKVTRHTADIDFLITRADFEKLKPALLDMGYSVVHEQDVFAQLQGRMLRDVDFMFSDKETVTSIVENGVRTKISGEEFVVPSLNHLIAMKLHSIKYNSHRELHDLPDIVYLMQANSLSPHSPRIRAVFKKYGTPELFEKVKRFFR